MKIVNLCSSCNACPVVKITDEFVDIGEEGNLCRLKIDEWNTLKEKIINKEM